MNYDIKCSKCPHVPTVACGSLSQRCQCLSPVTQPNLTKVRLKLGNWFWLLCSFC